MKGILQVQGQPARDSDMYRELGVRVEKLKGCDELALRNHARVLQLNWLHKSDAKGAHALGER